MRPHASAAIKDEDKQSIGDMIGFWVLAGGKRKTMDCNFRNRTLKG